MKNKEQPNMLSVKALSRFLVETWRESSCPFTEYDNDNCLKCEYNVLCSKIEELVKVVGR